MTGFRAWVSPIAVFIVLSNPGCEKGDLFTLDGVNHTRAAEIRELIAAELQPGKSAEQIERFFESKDITYSYDRFANRYQAIIRDVATGRNADQAIVIYINVDEKRRFLSAEVRDSFTAP